MVDDFIDKLVGTYNNRDQAYCDPSRWAHRHVKFVMNSEGLLYSKSWYNIKDQNQPYKQSLYTITQDGNFVLMSDKNITMKFHWDGQWWTSFQPRCEIPSKNIYISTSMKFNGYQYRSRDAIYALDTGKFVRGKRPEEGEFIFVKNG